MSKMRKYPYFKVILVFTFVGPWLGCFVFFLLFHSVLTIIEFRAGLLVEFLLNFLFLPISSLGGIVFVFPPALITGIIAALLKLKRDPSSLIIISLTGAALSGFHAYRMFRYGFKLDSVFWHCTVFASLGLCVSYLCGRYTFPIVSIESSKEDVH